MLVDLHVHSTESDGSLTPEELCAQAAGAGIGVLALCDHDTTSGIRRFVEAGAQAGVVAIGGVEISATWPLGNCHILGLGLRDGCPKLEEVLHRIRDSREHRNERILDRLRQAGVFLDLAEVAAVAGGDVVGRPHIARVMQAKGYVRSVQEAFDKYLTKGAAAYVDRFRLEPPDAVALLKDSGAAVVLAHPPQLKIGHGELANLIERLAPHGLDGIEAYTPYASNEDIAAYVALCREHSLLVSGGSDFHGVSKPAHVMGYFREGEAIPAERVDVERIVGRLRAASARPAA